MKRKQKTTHVLYECACMCQFAYFVGKMTHMPESCRVNWPRLLIDEQIRGRKSWSLLGKFDETSLLRWPRIIKDTFPWKLQKGF
jgi:hypothetical protein